MGVLREALSEKGARVESVIVALIGGVVTLAGVLIANSRTQASIEAKVDELARRVEKHNSMIERTYALESRMAVVETKLEVKE